MKIEQKWKDEWDREFSVCRQNENIKIMNENSAPPSKNIQFERLSLFQSPVYVLSITDFLDTVSSVSEEYIQKTKQQKTLNELYPVYMTDNYVNDDRLRDFTEFIGMSAWNVLNDQGYAMDNFGMTFNEMWTQQHYKHSSMEQHTHGFGSVISGFYFLDCPENCSTMLFHDPRPAKVITSLPVRDNKVMTDSSNIVQIVPTPGLLVISNSWLPHSFTRHGSKKPIKFVHFNLSITHITQNSNQDNSVEIV